MTERHNRRCAVLGSPIGHSLSPVIHQAAYRYLGLDWTYTAHDVDEAGLAGFVAALDADWRGLSLTMPLKRVALDVADDSSELARTVGAANTLVRSDDGRLTADNTDVPGLVAALRERHVGTPATACVWGGGATAASALAAMATIGVPSSHVHARSVGRAQAALSVAAALGHHVELEPWQVHPRCAAADLTVNTTPAGALDPLADTLGAAANETRALFDVVYDPWPTAVARRWQAAAGVVVGGLDLLVHQALGQVRLMTGRDAPVHVLREAAEQALAGRAAT